MNRAIQPHRDEQEELDTEILDSDPARARSADYLGAVGTCLALLTDNQWRPAKIKEIATTYGLPTDRARRAFSEACRHLQLDMGAIEQRQATSSAWLISQREACRARAEWAAEHAERWRAQEREAQAAADRLEPENRERIAALETAARFGFLAARLDLSAEKWSAQALAHQRQLDDVLGLRSPRELHSTQVFVSLEQDPRLAGWWRVLWATLAELDRSLMAYQAEVAALTGGVLPAVELPRTTPTVREAMRAYEAEYEVAGGARQGRTGSGSGG